jgi:hypothetical protein
LTKRKFFCILRESNKRVQTKGAKVEAIKALELLGWEVIEVVKVNHDGWCAKLIKDGEGIYLEIDTEKMVMCSVDNECPCCGRNEVVLTDECPECQEDWEYRKDIDQEYLDLGVKEVTGIVGDVFEGHKKLINKALQFKGGENGTLDVRNI